MRALGDARSLLVHSRNPHQTPDADAYGTGMKQQFPSAAENWGGQIIGSLAAASSRAPEEKGDAAGNQGS
jgi:hypothetical protein